MAVPWFDPTHYAWITGVAYGCLAAFLAGFTGWLVPRGRGRQWMVAAWSTLWAVAVVLLGIGLYALVERQPWGVWYAFLLPGVVGFSVVGANFFLVLRKYREVEHRRLAAKDLF